MNSKAGKLLIAHPNLPADNYFSKSVIYIYSDNDSHGTLGLCLNKKSGVTMQDLCDQRSIEFPYPSRPVYKGGPVTEQSIIMIHTSEWAGLNTTTAGPNYLLTSDNVMFEHLALGNQPAYWRMCLGLCAWKVGQLDLELSGQFPYSIENSWLIADANDYIMFELDGEEQWVASVDLCSKQLFSTYF